MEEGDMQEGRRTGGKPPLAQLPVDPSTDLSENEGYQASPHVPHGHDAYGVQQHGPALYQQFPGGHPFNAPNQHLASYSAGPGQHGNTFNMSGMSGALPEYQPSAQPHRSQQSQQRFAPGVAATIGLGFQPQPVAQFAGHASINTQGYPTYPPQYATPYQHAAATAAAQAYAQAQAQGSQHSRSGGPSPTHASYTPPSYFPSHQQQQFVYYPGQYGQGSQPQQGMQGHTGPPSTPYLRGPNHPYGQLPLQQQEGDLTAMGGKLPVYGNFVPGAPGSYNYGSAGPLTRPGDMPVLRRGTSTSSTGVIPSSPRGPPRKPKQSGHALWVGNLPSGATVNDLKDHFSREATTSIESVFLISKSNCAFVNYRTDAACAAAMTRFHDSRFQGVRLVCRLRRSSAAPSPGVPTGPAALVPAVAQSQTAFEAITQNREISSRAEELANAEASRDGEGSTKATDKYFIMKSLTVEDMELSIRNGIWATQAHNEDALNKAFETAENVYLVFSANKSGEYFGFARMASPITEAASATLDWAPRAESVVDDPDLPRSIPTGATEFAPRGRIIDDSARGTIFWEADPEDEDVAPLIDGEVEDPEETLRAEGVENAEDSAAAAGAQAFGKPFKIEWLATNRLPFYRTRGLRNPWNANREVKIARDGTELETSVGRRLVQMFQKSIPSPSPPVQMGWSPIRPY